MTDSQDKKIQLNKIAVLAFGAVAAVISGAGGLAYEKMTKDYTKTVEGTFHGECDLRQERVGGFIMPTAMETSLSSLTIYNEADMKQKSFKVSSTYAPGGTSDTAIKTSCTQAFAEGTHITLAYTTNAWREYVLETAPDKARIVSPSPWN